jgi:hypothetical protein
LDFGAILNLTDNLDETVFDLKTFSKENSLQFGLSELTKSNGQRKLTAEVTHHSQSTKCYSVHCTAQTKDVLQILHCTLNLKKQDLDFATFFKSFGDIAIKHNG